jgi:hypothetical protein
MLPGLGAGRVAEGVTLCGPRDGSSSVSATGLGEDCGLREPDRRKPLSLRTSRLLALSSHKSKSQVCRPWALRPVGVGIESACVDWGFRERVPGLEPVLVPSPLVTIDTSTDCIGCPASDLLAKLPGGRVAGQLDDTVAFNESMGRATCRGRLSTTYASRHAARCRSERTRPRGLSVEPLSPTAVSERPSSLTSPTCRCRATASSSMTRPRHQERLPVETAARERRCRGQSALCGLAPSWTARRGSVPRAPVMPNRRRPRERQRPHRPPFTSATVANGHASSNSGYHEAMCLLFAGFGVDHCRTTSWTSGAHQKRQSTKAPSDAAASEAIAVAARQIGP